MRSPRVSQAQMCSPTFTWGFSSSNAFTWVEEMQMRSGVVRDEIGGGKWQMYLFGGGKWQMYQSLFDKRIGVTL